MRVRILAAGLALALCAVVWTRGAGPRPASDPPRPRPSLAGPRDSEDARESVPLSSPVRDPFRYESELAALPRPSPRLPLAPSGPRAASGAALRVVGFLEVGGVIKAVLSVSGDIVVVGPGEPAGPFIILSVDEETGVRVKGPEGEVQLPPS